MSACCMCGTSYHAGITVHDFKFDEPRTPHDWHFCPNCSVTTGVRMISNALTPEEFKKLRAQVDVVTFQLHEDFYDDEGNALQPVGHLAYGS